MKKIYLIFLYVGFVGCSKNPYMLSDENSDKDYLIDYIDELKSDGLITKKPSLVLNGELITYNRLKECELVLLRNDIDTINGFFKKNDSGAQAIYGENGKNGVILMNVKRFNLICD